MTFCSFKYNSYIIYQILMLWEIYFNFFWPYFQMELLLLSYLMYLPNLSLLYTLFCLPKSVFSHIKKIDKKETCQRLIAQVLNCHCKPCDHRESFFSFHGVSQLISQWHFTAAVIFLCQASGMMAFGLFPNTYFVSSCLCQFYSWEIFIVIKTYNANKAFWVWTSEKITTRTENSP